ncbi:MAG: alkaline phosphatase PhoX, partial [Cyanobacteria bacterium J06642_3]
MNHDNNSTNRSGNRPFEDILKASFSRRNLFKRSAALSATGFLGALASNNLVPKSASAGTVFDPDPGLINFAELTIAEATADPRVPSISVDYEYSVLIPWGTPILPGGPEYTGDPNARPTSAEQEQQVGIGHDGMWFFAKNGTSNTEGMLCINHEFGTNFHVLGKEDPESLEDVRRSQHAHGVSVVALRKARGSWGVVASPNSRRIHVNTPVEFSGPVAGHPLLENNAGNSPQGTVNNCANGFTPWGTYLTCEENFNGYFGSTEGEIFDENLTPEQDRYGFSSVGFNFGWFQFDPRFDLSNPDYANEHHRFGWVVEVDPNNGRKTAVKRTALGRFKHEGFAFATGAGGRAVGYMGDDERFDYCYRYVSDTSWRSMIARGLSPFDFGKLYVARFNEDNTGEWLELTINNPLLAERFNDQAEVLVFARIAADILGATPMDRPEWTTVAPDGSVFWSLTNNNQRETPGPANPLAPNDDGHIIRTTDTFQNTGLNFAWEIVIIAEDTHAEGDERNFSDPDGRPSGSLKFLSSPSA